MACKGPPSSSGLQSVTRLGSHLANHMLLHQPGCRQERANAGDRAVSWPTPWEFDPAPPQPQASFDSLPRKMLTSGLVDSQLNKGRQAGELGTAFPRAGSSSTCQLTPARPPCPSCTGHRRGANAPWRGSCQHDFSDT